METETIVKRCCDCPMFSLEHGGVMFCGHPYWGTQAPYSDYIITQSNRASIPVLCPLRHGPLERTIMLEDK